MSSIEDIKAFHEKFGLAYRGKPRAILLSEAEFRHKFAHEEANEYLANNDGARQAMSEDDQAEYTYHLNHLLDALVDQMYVLMGTIYLHGMLEVFPEAWARVHERNMAKVRATSEEQSTRGSKLDVIKPEGWYPPDHTDLVEDNDRA